MLKFSFIVPVYNRPQEVKELLNSFLYLKGDDFEIIVVEDGSDDDCREIVEAFVSDFKVQYHYKGNTGPGPTRNIGAEKASGEWLIFLDSDTLIPTDYLKAVEDSLQDSKIDMFGGADRDQADFLPIQKAISYSMTSFLTTGGIRGSNRSVEKFKPRSFNMGIKKEVFEALGGFSTMRYGEDIDLSLRVEKAGYSTAYVHGAFVYHKRRTTFKSFFNQVKRSGEARILLSQKHKGSFKLVYLFPSIFILGLLLSVPLIFLTWPLSILGILIYLTYSFAIWIDAASRSKSLSIGFLSIIASYVQLFGYGLGFLKEGTISIFKAKL